MSRRLLPAWQSAVLVLALAVAACSPTFDWRELRPEGSGARVLFPCKPATQSRNVTLGATRLRMTIHACRAGDALFALGHGDVADPARVAPVLAELRDAAARNVHAAQAPARQPLMVRGMTPNVEAGRYRLDGRRPDGSLVQEVVALFARGTTVYQATVLGAAPEAVETFIAELRFAP